MPIPLASYNPRTWPGASESQFRRSVWEDVSELRAKINELVNEVNASSAALSSDVARLSTSNLFALGTTNDFHSRVLVDADLDDPNVDTRWLRLVDTHDGIDLVNTWNSGLNSTTIRLYVSNGQLYFQLSGDVPSLYAYSFDQPIAAPDLKLTATIADPTGYSVSNPPTQAEVQAILTTVQDIYAAIK